jgi:ADP-ribose pyrophosphatase YjhB (NUDIX family)
MVERLNEPQGLAFPGGHIYPHEPAEVAIVREVREETGFEAQNVKFKKPLVGLRRDSRGVKVSLLFTLTGVGINHYGENGKTKVKLFDRSTLRKTKPKQFVFDVYEVLKQEIMSAK